MDLEIFVSYKALRMSSLGSSPTRSYPFERITNSSKRLSESPPAPWYLDST